MDQARELAQRLGWPLCQQVEGHPLVLIVDEQGLALSRPGEAEKPLRVDFGNRQLAWRLRQGARQEALNKAVGLSKNADLSVLDATAGLGRDSFLMAAIGGRVRALERHPVLHCMLQAALKQAALEPELAEIAERIELLETDSLDWLAAQAAGRVDVIYLDPMFPARDKSARVKKDMQILHQLLGPGDNADALLEAALDVAGKRVVVKRPRLAPVLAGRTPSHQLTGRSSRFDVYAR